MVDGHLLCMEAPLRWLGVSNMLICLHFTERECVGLSQMSCYNFGFSQLQVREILLFIVLHNILLCLVTLCVDVMAAYC